MEELKCPNCGEIGVAGDRRCWQCGTALTAVAAATVVDADERGETAVAHTHDDEPLTEEWMFARLVIVYGGSALFFFGLALIMFYYLGQQPKVQVNNWRLVEGWQAYLAGQDHFAIELPTDWDYWDAYGPVADEVRREAVVANPYYAQAMVPWVGVVDDLELLFVAAEDDLATLEVPARFVLVARSRQMKGLNVRETAEGSETTSTVRYEDNFARSHWRIFHNMTLLGEANQCLQNIYDSKEERIVVAVCFVQASGFSGRAVTILDSFEPAP
ncbi:MAG TPA: hypothetical protein VLL52_13915 [Anaerolineae bacterium]|nr:hypothetical protein [Anaerolineae bacterium]